jgi:hypothetical protein
VEEERKERKKENRQVRCSEKGTSVHPGILLPSVSRNSGNKGGQQGTRTGIPVFPSFSFHIIN